MGVPRGVGLCLSIARSRCVRSPPTLGMLPPSAYVEGPRARGSAARASEWLSGMSYCSRHSAKRRRIPGAAELDSPSAAWSEARMRTSLSVSTLLRSSESIREAKSQEHGCRPSARTPARASIFVARAPDSGGEPSTSRYVRRAHRRTRLVQSGCVNREGNVVVFHQFRPPLHRLHDSSCSASRLAVRRIALLFRSVDRTRRVRRNALYSALRTRLASLVQLLLTLL